MNFCVSAYKLIGLDHAHIVTYALHKNFSTVGVDLEKSYDNCSLVFRNLNFGYARSSLEIKKFDERNIKFMKFRAPDKKFPRKGEVLAQIHLPENSSKKV